MKNFATRRKYCVNEEVAECMLQATQVAGDFYSRGLGPDFVPRERSPKQSSRVHARVPDPIDLITRVAVRAGYEKASERARKGNYDLCRDKYKFIAR
jgi:hypothetical protein